MQADIQINESRISLPLEAIIGSMTLDQKREMLSWLASDDQVIDAVVGFIVGEDEMGWSTGDPNRRQAILERIEDNHLSDAVKYSWKPWDELRQKIKDIRTAEHIYWVLYHKIGTELSSRVFEKLREIGVKDNYTNTEADAEIAELKEHVANALKSMKKAATL